MMNYILLGVSLCLGVTKNIIPKLGDFSGVEALMRVNMITALVALAVFLSGGLNFEIISGELIIMAIIYGACTLGSQSLYMLAVRDGSVSVCSLIYASCFMIPTVFTAFYYGEAFSVLRGVGIAVMLLSVILVSAKGEKQTSASKAYLLPAVLAMLCAGVVGILQKLFARTYSGKGLNEFLFMAFLFMLVISFFGKTAIRKKTKQQAKFYVFALIMAVSVVAANKLNMILAGALPGMVFFPVINGGTIMLSAVFSGLLFKERLLFISWIGIFVGISAIVLIAC